jgi:hypothetical protein
MPKTPEQTPQSNPSEIFRVPIGRPISPETYKELQNSPHPKIIRSIEPQIDPSRLPLPKSK